MKPAKAVIQMEVKTETVSAISNKYPKLKYFFLIPVALLLFSLNIFYFNSFLKNGFSGYKNTMAVYAFIIIVTAAIPGMKKVWRFNILIALSLLFFSETYLRISKKGFPDYMERNSTSVFGPYMSQYHEYSGIRDGIYWLHPPNSKFQDTKAEFNFQYNYNELGLRERPMSEFLNNKSNILILGDSYTEGVGAPQDKNTPSSVEARLKSVYKKNDVKVINGGVNGSDLFFSYKLLERLYPTILPKVVVLNINSSDISDVSCRGGDGRFVNNKVEYENKGPWWEYIYSVSFILRTITNNVFHVSPAKYKYNVNLEIDYGKVIYDKIIHYDSFCKNRNVKFIVVFTPLVFQIVKSRFPYDKLIELLKINTDITIINLKEVFQQTGYITGDNFKEYYYQNDYHFKPDGYILTGNIIADEIVKYIK